MSNNSRRKLYNQSQIKTKQMRLKNQLDQVHWLNKKESKQNNMKLINHLRKSKRNSFRNG